MTRIYSPGRQLRGETSIGIDTGAAIVGEVGSDQRRRFTVFGRVVNTAWRLNRNTSELAREALPMVFSRETMRDAGLLLELPAAGDCFVEFSTDVPDEDAPESLFAVWSEAEPKFSQMLRRATTREGNAGDISP